MRFAFSEEQVLSQGAVRALLEREMPGTALRAAWADDAPRPSSAWKRLAEMGVVGMTVPEAHGGLGENELAVVLLLEECGRVALPDPIVETTAVGAPLLAELAHDERAAAWLSAVASGEGTLALGLSEGSLVVDADRAQALLLARGGSLFAVTPDRVRLTRQRSVDGARRLYRVEGDIPASAKLADGHAAARAIALANDRGAAATAAVLVGLGRRMMDLAVDHVKTRTQFGVPIGSFQAVKHHLASAHLALEFARPAVYRAALALSSGAPDRATWVSLAKAHASEAATLAARAALQCHGAIGYSFEHDLHLYMKRTWALAASFGDAAWHRARVAAIVLDDASPTP